MADRFSLRRARRVKALEEWRRNSEQDSRASQDQLDKALMTLSAGGIGTTIAFLDKIVPFASASLQWLLFLIWLFWGFCLLVTVFSFYASVRTLARAAGQIAVEIRSVQGAADPDKVDGADNDGGWWNSATKWSNEISAALFALGLVAMLVFIWYNLFITNPKSPQQQLNEGQTAITRPAGTEPSLRDRGLPALQRPSGSSPTSSNSSAHATSDGNAKLRQEKK